MTILNEQDQLAVNEYLSKCPEIEGWTLSGAVRFGLEFERKRQSEMVGELKMALLRIQVRVDEGGFEHNQKAISDIAKEALNKFEPGEK